MAADESVYLHDDHVAIRFPVEADASAIWDAVQEAAPHAGQWIPLLRRARNADDVRNYIRNQLRERTAGRVFSFVIIAHHGAGVLGSCWLARLASPERCGALSYWVRDSHRGEGIAPRAIRLVARFGFESVGFQRIEMVIATENTASIRVADKLGALREGFVRNRIFVHEAVHDAVLYALLPQHLSQDPSLSKPDRRALTGRDGRT